MKIFFPLHRQNSADNSSKNGSLPDNEAIPLPSQALTEQLLIKKKKVLLARATTLFVLPLIGAIVGLYLIKLNQDLRQQASEGVYSAGTKANGERCSSNNDCISGSCQTAPGGKYCLAANTTTTINPYEFAQSATTANTDEFVVNPEELGYDPDEIIVTENVFFDRVEEQGYWARGYEWDDRRNTRNEYHSTIWGYTEPGTAEERFEAHGSQTSVNYISTANVNVGGVNHDNINIYQANDTDGTVNFSFYVGDYFVILKAKNTSVETAIENLEKMAELLVADLQQ